MKTADIVDRFDSDVQFCELPFRRYGRRIAFHGPVRTVKCHEDNALVKATLATPGDGHVLVVDGGGSRRTALLGDILAGLLHEHHWAGIVIHGVIRDSLEVDDMDVGVRCLGVSPKKSAKDGAGAVDTPVSFGGVEFRPGHWVYVDADGVLVSTRRLTDKGGEGNG